MTVNLQQRLEFQSGVSYYIHCLVLHSLKFSRNPVRYSADILHSIMADILHSITSIHRLDSLERFAVQYLFLSNIFAEHVVTTAGGIISEECSVTRTADWLCPPSLLPLCRRLHRTVCLKRADG